jgi:hypothetical protein
MQPSDVENELKKLRLVHLTRSELLAFFEQQLDPVRRARAEAHLKQCFICERLLKLLGEDAELGSQQVTAEDAALVERLWGQSESGAEPPSRVALREWLTESLRQMVASWLVAFQPVRHADQGEEVWTWRSEDGRLRARAIIEKNADMIVRFSSDEMELDGARLRFRLGSLSQELILRRTAESEVAAQVAIPWPYRRGSMMSDISIELV